MDTQVYGVDRLIEAGIVAVSGTRRALKALKDGFQTKDLTAVLSIVGDIETIIDNRREIVKEIQNLNPGETTYFILKVAEGSKLNPDDLTVQIVVDTFLLLDQSSAAVLNAINIVGQWSDLIMRIRAVNPSVAPASV